jgi:Ca2+/H+ antiporter, TMEM165/GDT1 family
MLEPWWLGYVVVVVAAAVPWVELLAVIPVAIAAGLHPGAVALLAFAGNALPVFAIVGGYGWWHQRRAGAAADAAGEGGIAWARARRLFVRYGLPGLALLGPPVTGIHIATVIALALHIPKRAVAWWMTGSLALWAAAVAAVSAAGVEFLLG